MPAEMKIIPGLFLSALPGKPTITRTEEESRVAYLPGLVHYLEPDRLAIPSTGGGLAGKDRGTTGHPIATPSTAITVPALAAYNNRKVVTKLAAHAAFAYNPKTAPKSFTVICVADLSATRIAAALSASLWAFYNGEIGASTVKYALSWRPSDGRFQFMENYSAGGAGLLMPAVNMPVGDQKFVLVVSYDAETRTSRMSINGPDVLASLVHTGTAPVIDSNTRFAIGGLYQYGSAGWDGHIGRTILLDRNYHDPAYLPLLTTEITALRTYYAI